MLPCLLVAYYCALYREPGLLKVVKWEFASPEIPGKLDGFRIALIADIHANNHSINLLNDAIEKINSLHADLVLLAGDFVNGNGAGVNINHLVKALKKLSAPCGVYGVPGNHDYRYGIASLKKNFADTHVKLLFDQQTFIESAGGGVFNLIGLDYKDNPHERFDRSRSRNLRQKGMFNLFLTHTPEDFLYIDDDNVLVLAGHTHGGQLYIPGLGSVVNPPRYGRKFTYGVIQHNRKTMFISSGMGSAYTQGRMFMRPEIVIITLKSLHKK